MRGIARIFRSGSGSTASGSTASGSSSSSSSAHPTADSAAAAATSTIPSSTNAYAHYHHHPYHSGIDNATLQLLISMGFMEPHISKAFSCSVSREKDRGPPYSERFMSELVEWMTEHPWTEEDEKELVSKEKEAELLQIVGQMVEDVSNADWEAAESSKIRDILFQALGSGDMQPSSVLQLLEDLVQKLIVKINWELHDEEENHQNNKKNNEEEDYDDVLMNAEKTVETLSQWVERAIEVMAIPIFFQCTAFVISRIGAERATSLECWLQHVRAVYCRGKFFGETSPQLQFVFDKITRELQEERSRGVAIPEHRARQLRNIFDATEYMNTISGRFDESAAHPNVGYTHLENGGTRVELKGNGPVLAVSEPRSKGVLSWSLKVVGSNCAIEFGVCPMVADGRYLFREGKNGFRSNSESGGVLPCRKTINVGSMVEVSCDLDFKVVRFCVNDEWFEQTLVVDPPLRLAITFWNGGGVETFPMNVTVDRVYKPIAAAALEHYAKITGSYSDLDLVENLEKVRKIWDFENSRAQTLPDVGESIVRFAVASALRESLPKAVKYTPLFLKLLKGNPENLQETGLEVLPILQMACSIHFDIEMVIAQCAPKPSDSNSDSSNLEPPPQRSGNESPRSGEGSPGAGHHVVLARNASLASTASSSLSRQHSALLSSLSSSAACCCMSTSLGLGAIAVALEDAVRIYSTEVLPSSSSSPPMPTSSLLVVASLLKEVKWAHQVADAVCGQLSSSFADASQTAAAILRSSITSGISQIVHSLGDQCTRGIASAINILFDVSADEDGLSLPGGIEIDSIVSLSAAFGASDAANLLKTMREMTVRRVARGRSRNLEAEIEFAKKLNEVGLPARGITRCLSFCTGSERHGGFPVDPSRFSCTVIGLLDAQEAFPGLVESADIPMCLPSDLIAAAETFRKHWLQENSNRDSISAHHRAMSPSFRIQILNSTPNHPLKSFEETPDAPFRQPRRSLNFALSLGLAEVHVIGTNVTLLASTLQMVILQLVNDAADNEVSYGRLRQECGAAETDLQQALLSLTAPKHPVLKLMLSSTSARNSADFSFVNVAANGKVSNGSSGMEGFCDEDMLVANGVEELVAAVGGNDRTVRLRSTFLGLHLPAETADVGITGGHLSQSQRRSIIASTMIRVLMKKSLREKTLFSETARICRYRGVLLEEGELLSELTALMQSGHVHHDPSTMLLKYNNTSSSANTAIDDNDQEDSSIVDDQELPEALKMYISPYASAVDAAIATEQAQKLKKEDLDDDRCNEISKPSRVAPLACRLFANVGVGSDSSSVFGSQLVRSRLHDLESSGVVRPLRNLSRVYSCAIEAMIVPVEASKTSFSVVDAGTVWPEFESVIERLERQHSSCNYDLLRWLAILSRCSWDLVALEINMEQDKVSPHHSQSYGQVLSVQCAVCLVEGSGDDPLIQCSGCEHGCHKDCWKMYLDSIIRDGHGVVGATCPGRQELQKRSRRPSISNNGSASNDNNNNNNNNNASSDTSISSTTASTSTSNNSISDEKCSNVIPMTVLTSVLTDDQDLQAWMAALRKEAVESYIASTADFVACDCGRLLRCRDVSLIVSCICGKKFCVGCKKRSVEQEESHVPATCADMQNWATLSIAGGPERLALLRFKPCPKCGRLTNKCGCTKATGIQCAELDKCPNAACDHITCSLAEGGCGHEWCWQCSMPYAGHKPEWHCAPRDSKERYLKCEQTRADAAKKLSEVAQLSIQADAHVKKAEIVASLDALEKGYKLVQYGQIAVFHLKGELYRNLVDAQCNQLLSLCDELQTLTEKIIKSDDHDGYNVLRATSLAVACAEFSRRLSYPQPSKRVQLAMIEADEISMKLEEEAAKRREIEDRKRREEEAAARHTQGIQVGMRVRRGVDWSYGNQDHHHGMESVGVVVSVREDHWIQVRWGNGQEHHYRYGGQTGRFDVRIVGIPSHAIMPDNEEPRRHVPWIHNVIRHFFRR